METFINQSKCYKIIKSKYLNDYVQITRLNEKQSLKFVSTYAYRRLDSEEEQCFDSFEDMLLKSEEFERCCGLPKLLMEFSLQLMKVPIYKVNFALVPKRYIKATKDYKILNENKVSSKVVSYEKGLMAYNVADIEELFQTGRDESCREERSMVLLDSSRTSTHSTKIKKNPSEVKLHNQNKKGAKTSGKMKRKYTKKTKNQYYNFNKNKSNNNSENDIINN